MNASGVQLVRITHSAIRKGTILISIIGRKLSIKKGKSMNVIQNVKIPFGKTRLIQLKLTDEQPNDSDLSDVLPIQ